MLAVVQLLLVVYRSILVGLGPLDIRYIIVCELPSPLPRASAIARALPAMLAVVQSLLVDVRQFPVSIDAISVASSRWCCLAPPLSPAPCPHCVLSSSSTGHCSMISHLSFRSMVSLFETLRRRCPAPPLARALLPCLLSSSSYWSMLGGLSIRSMAVLFESSRRCCLASPLSPEPGPHCSLSPVPAGRRLAVSPFARWRYCSRAPVGAASRLRSR